jgi:eight-cysteine-cluster-containing protein
VSGGDHECAAVQFELSPIDAGGRVSEASNLPLSQRLVGSAVILGLLALPACKKPATENVDGPELAATDPEPAGETTPAPPPATPETLYALCEGRVERPEAEGECSTEADCGTAGASSEVCTTAEAASDLMTTAENRRCFAVLDQCGCQAGLCRWSLLDIIPSSPGLMPTTPGMLPPTRNALPPTGGSLPPTTPDADGDGD